MFLMITLTLFRFLGPDLFKYLIFVNVYPPDCPIKNVLGWFPCVQVTSLLKCIRMVWLRAFKFFILIKAAPLIFK